MRKNIVIMNIMVACYWMTLYSYVPNLPEYARSLGADAAVLGIIGGAYGIAPVILRLPIGILSDKLGKNKRMLIIGMFILLLSCGILILAQNTGVIIAGRIVAGAAAAWWVVLNATYADYHTNDLQVRAQGILSASSSAGKVAATLMGGMIAQLFGVRSIFVFAFMLAVLCLFLAAGLKEMPKPPQKKTFRELLPLFKNRDLLIISGIMIFAQLLCFSGPILFTVVIAQDIGASSFQLGMLAMLFFAAAGVSSLFVGSGFYKKIGGIHALSAAFLISAFSFVPLFYRDLPSIFFMQALSGLGFGIVSSATAGLVIRSVAPEQRGAAVGIYQSLYAAGVLIGPVVAGSITQAVSLEAAYWFLAGLSVAAALLCYLLIPKKYARM